MVNNGTASSQNSRMYLRNDKAKEVCFIAKVAPALPNQFVMAQPQVAYRYLLADSWYASAENMTLVRTFSVAKGKFTLTAAAFRLASQHKASSSSCCGLLDAYRSTILLKGLNGWKD